jgi:AcrR family transcriptional regulator
MTRKRNAAATRAAILAAASRAFAESGYDGVGVRDIARNAGVTAMLVNRYFGSKEGLFAAAIAEIMRRPIVPSPETSQSADAAARDMTEALAAVAASDDAPLDGLRAAWQSASNPRAAAIAREQLETHVHRALTAAIPADDHAAQRAALALAFVAGVRMMRQTIGLTALADCDPEVLTGLLRPVFRQLWGAEDRREPPAWTGPPPRVLRYRNGRFTP